MKITNVRINGIKDPIGYQLQSIRCMWKVRETVGNCQAFAKIEVSDSRSFNQLIYQKEGKDLKSYGEKLEFQLQPRTRYYVRISVQNDRGETAVSDSHFFETGKMDEAWSGSWIGPAKEDKYHPVLMKTINSKGAVKSARLYVCGLGVYEAYLNHIKIEDEYLAPYVNDYCTEIQYQTYDILPYIQQEDTTQLLEISLGNGWYKGRLGYEGRSAIYGDRFAAIAELYIEYEDGSIDLIKTDDSWKYYGSDIEESDIYDGEIYNRMLWKEKENPYKPAEVLDIPKSKLTERNSIAVKVKEEISVKEVLITPKQEVVLDMGQNFAGYVEFEADLPVGTKVTLEFGEILQKGNFYNENYRTAKSRFIYVSSGIKEKVRPHFTFYGFRYVKVTGWPGEICQEAFSGKVVYSDLEQTGFLETGNEKINRLYENCLWGQKSNFLDIPTDCPQRDERLAWSGDAQVFAPTASYNMNTFAFFHKFLRELRHDQRKLDGAVPNYIPSMGMPIGGSSVWGDAATFIPFTLYWHYGDKEILAEHYEMMKDWVGYIQREDQAHGANNLFNFGMHFGDWLALDGATEQSFRGGTDDYYISSVYYYESARILAFAAGELGKPEDQKYYSDLSRAIKAAIYEEYYTKTGRLAVDTQTAYIIALRFGLYTDKQKIIEGLRRRLEKDCYRIKCGFVGAPVLCTTLAEHGLDDLAYHFLLQETFPSWLYCVNLGATTIWERWNSVLEDGSISGTEMNSLNHYSYGSVIEFLYKYTAGIQALEPGFKKVRFKPLVNIRLGYMKASYDSASGRYACEWHIEDDGRIKVRFEVPFDCCAVAILPGSKKEISIEPGIHEFLCEPEKDYRNLFTLESRLEDFEKSEEAMKVLEEELPVAIAKLKNGNMEDRTFSLNKMKLMPFMGYDPKRVDAAAARLLEIKRRY